MFDHFVLGTQVNTAAADNRNGQEEEHPSPRDTSTAINDHNSHPSPPKFMSGLHVIDDKVEELAGELSKQYIRGWDSNILVTPDVDADAALDDRIPIEAEPQPTQQPLADPPDSIVADTMAADAIAADTIPASLSPSPSPFDALQAESQAGVSLLDCYVAYRHSRAGSVPASSAMSLASSGVRKNCGGLPLRFRLARDVANSSRHLVRNRPRMRKRDDEKSSSSKRSSVASSARSEGSVASFELACES